MKNSTRPAEPQKKTMKSRHRMNRSSRQTQEVVSISLDVPELRGIIRNVKKLEYSVGCFNSYTQALMKMLDQSMCGFSICLQRDKDAEHRRVKVSRASKKGEDTSEGGASSQYLKGVREAQIEMSEKIFREINTKIQKLEEHFLREIPEIRKVFQQARLLLLDKGTSDWASKRTLRTEPEIFPRLKEYSPPKNVGKESQFKTLLLANIVAMRYTYCSDLLFFLDSENRVVIYDLFQRRICHQFSQWPFRLRNLILRRNLNFYNSKSLLKVEFSKFDQFLSRGSAAEGKTGPVTAEEFHDLAFIGLSLKDYFSRFSDEVWFHKRGKRDKYILVFQFFKKRQLMFFNFVYKFTKLQKKTRNESIRTSQRGSSMVNLSRSVSLHKQKTKKISRLFTRTQGPSE